MQECKGISDGKREKGILVLNGSYEPSVRKRVIFVDDCSTWNNRTDKKVEYHKILGFANAHCCKIDIFLPPWRMGFDP